MKTVPSLVASALATGVAPLARIEIWDVTLLDGTNFYWSTYDSSFEWLGNVYLSQNPFLRRGSWKVTNSMEIPVLSVTLLSLTDGFNGGLDIRSQIMQGLLDGAEMLLQYLYVDLSDGSQLGTIVIFGGVVSTARVRGSTANIKIKGANNKLDQNAPRRVYQITCSNTFCDPGCTLLRVSFTLPYVVDVGVTKVFIPWTIPPGDPSLYQFGTVTMTSGPATGQSMNIDFADASGLTLVVPLYNLPVAGDTFTAFEGCIKTRVRCDSRGNEQNGLWFPYIPPAETAF